MHKWLILPCIFILLISIKLPISAREEGLVLYFKFDNLDGDFLKDESGMENHGTFFGDYKLVDGKIGKGVVMEGNQANRLVVADSDSLDITEVYTMAVWVNFTEITGQRHQFFFDKGADDKAPGGWRLGKLMSGQLRFQIFKDAVWQGADDLQNPNFQPGQWYHCAVTRDAGGNMKIYLNGVPGVSVNKPAYILPVNENELIVWGSDVFGPNNMFTGIMDELAIFKDRALTEAQIKSFMESGQSAIQSSDKLSVTWGSVKSSKLSTF